MIIHYKRQRFVFRSLFQPQQRGEVLLAAILTLTFISGVLVYQYRCFQMEEQNCQQVQRQMRREIVTNLKLSEKAH